MPFKIVDFSTINQIVDLVLAIILVLIIVYLCIRFKFHIYATIFLGVTSAALIICWLFQFELTFYVLFVVILTTVFILCISHIGAIRTSLQKRRKTTVEKKVLPDKIVDRQAIYHEVYEAVVACSRSKIGALITFERHDNLKDLTKNGTIVNAPVTKELLMTIFYPGTRLHDGAVIIKDGMIYAASVYYTPTTKALTGKYGSRHRAAIGISEISDSVTVVVSEETGRISIAQDGEIEPILPDDFLTALDEHMKQTE